MNYVIRPIRPEDNQIVEHIIRTCLIEYGGNHEGTAWTDPDLGRFSEVYVGEGRRYWVAQTESGEVMAGVGIGELSGVPGVCELQKMYCLKEARGTGAAVQLIEAAFDYARQYYQKCYLETLDKMTRAQAFYEKNGFHRISGPFGHTGHYSCDVCYLKNLE